jgi:hypothetical protein
VEVDFDCMVAFWKYKNLKKAPPDAIFRDKEIKRTAASD